MSSNKCACENYRDFKGEFAIQFPGAKGLQTPTVLVFPKVRVCLDCGYAEFTVPERELRVLVTGANENGAVAFNVAGKKIAPTVS